MAQYLRKTGEHFNKALHAFGRWCHGVTSKNANVRSDMYKNIVAQIRGASKQMQETAQKALHQNVHGFWVTLVDDFNMIREEHSEQQLDLAENAAQLIGIILTDNKCLDKLLVHDVRNLMENIVTRIEEHYLGIRSLGKRLPSHVWLLSLEVPKWWIHFEEFYTKRLCGRLCDVASRLLKKRDDIDLVKLRCALEIVRIAYSRFPNVSIITFDHLVYSSFQLMWHTDAAVRRSARKIAKAVADHHGGQRDLFQWIELKFQGVGVFKDCIGRQVLCEYEKSPADALELWIIITRLLKDHILKMAGPDLKFWLRIPQDRMGDEIGGTAALAMHYATYYCQSKILANNDYLDAFKAGFHTIHNGSTWGLNALERNLAAFHVHNALNEATPLDRLPQPPDLKVWATLTVHAFNQNHPLNDIEQDGVQPGEVRLYLELVGLIYCHWDYLLRVWITERDDDDAFGNGAKTQELVEICKILKDFGFSQYIQDKNNVLDSPAKHAVNVFWFNLMASILSRDEVQRTQIFPVKILQSILPMVIGGLRSTQRRIRQSTYRFVIHGSILSALCFLREEESVELLRAMEEARNTYDADIYLDHQAIPQIAGWGEIVEEAKVEALKPHPLTLSPRGPSDGLPGDLNWEWFDTCRMQYCRLGDENTFSTDELDRGNIAEQERKQREKERLARKAGKEPLTGGPVLGTSSRAANKENYHAPGGHLAGLADRDKTQDQTTPSSHPSQQNHPAPSTSSSHPPTAHSHPPPTHTEYSQQQTLNTSQSAPANGQLPQPENGKHMPPPAVDWRSKSRPTVSFSLPPTTTSHTSTPSRKRPHDDDEEPTSPNKKRELESDHASTSRPSHPNPSILKRKRPHDDDGPSSPPKKRQLKCDYMVPAALTSWKPSWLKTTQCYPVNAKDEELSDKAVIWGHSVYQRAGSMRDILEKEYMYMPTHEVVDKLLRRANETFDDLKRAKRFLNEYPDGPIRIVQHKFA